MTPRAAIITITACFLSLAASKPPKPRIEIHAPRIVLANIAEPTEILARFKFINAPECFGVGVAWGDGESSTWETCDETSWSKPHRYKLRGAEVVITAALWVRGKIVSQDQTTVELR